MEVEVTEEQLQEERAKIMEDAYNEIPPEVPVVEEAPESEPEPEPEPETKDSEPEDPLAGLDPALRQSIQAMEERIAGIDKMEHRLKQAERRVGSLQNELSAAKAAKKDVDDAPTQKQVTAALKSTEKWEKLKSEFPDFTEAFDERLAELAPKTDPNTESLISEYEKKIETLSQTSVAEREALKKEIEVLRIETRHPDWEEVKSSEGFRKWFKAQPKQVQDLGQKSTRAKDAIAILDSYKQHIENKPTTTEIKQQRQQRLKDSESVKGKKLPASKSEADMTEAEYREHVRKKLWPGDK